MAKGKKVKPRRHGRAKVVQQDDKGVLERRNDAIRKFDREFRLNLPHHEASEQNAVSSGSYAQVEGDKYHDKQYPIADGKYRVEGSDWVFTFEGAGFVEAVKAEAPHFGGKDVIAIANG